ncbi:MAG: hypothetical protein CSA62_12125 [Planctomycetota bacterium]|nr:MAG: hypothetical protein CSA62_12125 [Planctomycetota bacterium]
MVNRCQLRCVMCHFAHPDFVESDMEMDRPLLEKVASELFPLAHDVVLSSSAEPLIAKELPRALELCREYEVPFFHFSTNAMALTEKIMEKVCEVQMPVMTVSADGASKETFEKIRRPAKWGRFLSKLALVDRVKERLGSEYPKLSATCVLMRSNIEEAADFVRLFAEHGVSDINFVHMGVLGGLGLENETLSLFPQLSNEKIAEAKSVAQELGVGLMAPMPFPESMYESAGREEEAASSDEGGGQAIVGSEGGIDVCEFLEHKNREFNLAVTSREEHRRMCYFPWYYIHVNPNGTVFPCGHWFEFSTFGDFTKQSFGEIWTGPEFTELRRQIRDLELRPVCANCTISGMGRPDVLASFSRREKQRGG